MTVTGSLTMMSDEDSIDDYDEWHRTSHRACEVRNLKIFNFGSFFNMPSRRSWLSISRRCCLTTSTMSRDSPDVSFDLSGTLSVPQLSYFSWWLFFCSFRLPSDTHNTQNLHSDNFSIFHIIFLFESWILRRRASVICAWIFLSLVVVVCSMNAMFLWWRRWL